MESREEMPAAEWTAEDLSVLLGTIRFRPSGRVWRRARPLDRVTPASLPVARLFLLLAMLAATGLVLYAFWAALWRLGH
jgi:hypothetical protein